jgi:hypothetical protein
LGIQIYKMKHIAIELIQVINERVKRINEHNILIKIQTKYVYSDGPNINKYLRVRSHKWRHLSYLYELLN